jgi:hypothetical protein
LAIVLSKLTDAFSPKSTGLNPFTFAAAASASKSLPALANSLRAASSWIQPCAALSVMCPSAASATCSAPVLLERTTFQP